MNRGTRIALATAAVLLVAAGSGWAWLRAQREVTTDDATVGAQVVQIAPEVGGRVVAVSVWEGQHVHRGDALFRIDAEPYRLAVQAAQARLASAREASGAGAIAVTAARAETAAQAAQAKNAEALARRDEELGVKGFLSPQAVDNARTQAASAEAAVRAAAERARQAQAAAGAPGDANAGVRAAEAALAQAQLNLDRTVVRAPADGRIAKLSLRPGTMVEAGAPQFALVDDARLWVDANFKETDLARIRVGQRAQVTIDMLPGKTFAGTVESIGAGAGDAFSLLPPENASGNWVKVTQRVPVRIRLADIDRAASPAVGASATATVEVAGGG